MIARVTLDLALGKEFDYCIPDQLAAQIEVGTRVKVPFAKRDVLGCVTALLESSPHANLRSILQVTSRQSHVSPIILRLARWMSQYYCCPPEIALKTVLPEAVRKEKEGWREKLFVRALPESGQPPRLSKRQVEILELARSRDELSLQELLEMSGASAATVRRLEDKGLVSIAAQISERDPYAREVILPSKPLPLNADQARALQEITLALGLSGGTGVPPVGFGVPPKPPFASAQPNVQAPPPPAVALAAKRSFAPITEPTARHRLLPHFEIPGKIYHVSWKTHEGLTLPTEAREKTLAACRFWHGTKMKCYLACVMPDHVHLLVQPLPIQQDGIEGVHSLSEILHGIKSYSSHEINQAMGRQGAVWQAESFDRMIRSETELHEKWEYIWNNPRVDRLVGPMEDYPFMWIPIAPTMRGDFGETPKSTGQRPVPPEEKNRARDNVSGGAGVPPVGFGVPPKPPFASAQPNVQAPPPPAVALAAKRSFAPITEPTARHRLLPHFEIPGKIYHVSWKTYEGLTLPPDAREKTLAACRFWHGTKMKCYLACVMPDHVHLLVQPLPIQQEGIEGVHALSEILHGIKSYSAHEINQAMGRQGPVWQAESFDRMIRSETELHEKWEYIWNNPRVDGLVGPMEEYPFMWFPGDSTIRGNFGGTPKSTGQRPVPPEEKNRASADVSGGTGVPPVGFGVPPKPPFASAPSNVQAPLPPAVAKPSRVFLLHGVTGSGKTEVYLQAIALALQQGKGAIVLVPEISLTPQTVERFKARFSAGDCQTLVAVLHSHLSQGERHDEWHKIRQGRARIVIGARSAVFAPVERLGLIIVDEEHEYSYKQEESPRYHARDVAVVRAQMEEAVVVLGSATPSMESFYNARKGKYRLLELPTRADDKKMPIVRVVDMRQVARREKGTPIFSPLLKEAIHRRLDRNEQTFLFINRRGFATSLQCPLCGYIALCPNCSLALTYHRQEQTLRCHVCDHLEPVPTVCPDAKCRNPAIRYAGLGTERVENALAALFPKARVRRMDSDALKRKEDYRRILGDVRTGKIDILVGTQMIAKGLHFPNVTLVGIIHADLSLHMPDFRAGERTFQLLTQVAGRAGRGDVEGEVVVQAFTPFHAAIQFARRHDFDGFYDQEMEFRRQLNYPPLTRLALVGLQGRNEEKVKFSADYVKAELAKKSETIGDLITAGPAPAPLARAKTNYRYQIMLRTRQITRLSDLVGQLAGDIKLPEGVSMTVDVDPVNLM